MQLSQGRGEVIGYPGVSGVLCRSTRGSDMMPFQGISPKVYLHINVCKEQSKLAHSKEPEFSEQFSTVPVRRRLRLLLRPNPPIVDIEEAFLAACRCSEASYKWEGNHKLGGGHYPPRWT